MGKRRMTAAGLALAAIGVTLATSRWRRFAIVESSMEPALEPGDWVLARRATGPLRRGDVVVFPDPLESDRFLVKRVVGLGGERIELVDGRVLVDGRPLDDPWGRGPTRPSDVWDVPDDAVFVLGDRRTVSAGDSRRIGPLPRSRIGWRVVARYWPPGRVGSL
ncbi:MAG TPA: signal peptidase I [Actinobacteria bacterium]|nr:signal peptidase I [Actinomycetota bacterium]